MRLCPQWFKYFIVLIFLKILSYFVWPGVYQLKDPSLVAGLLWVNIHSKSSICTSRQNFSLRRYISLCDSLGSEHILFYSISFTSVKCRSKLSSSLLSLYKTVGVWHRIKAADKYDNLYTYFSSKTYTFCKYQLELCQLPTICFLLRC